MSVEVSSKSVELKLRELDCELGASAEDVRKSYRLLSFIWHPDRQPESYVELAARKLQQINAAYEWLLDHEQQWSGLRDIDSIVDPQKVESVSYQAQKVDCVRCHGSGEVAKGVSWKGDFETESCVVCEGVGTILVDERNACRDCCGSGLREVESLEHREHWIDEQLKMRGLFDRHLNPNEYKRAWLRYHQDFIICRSCKGSGYFFLKKDARAEDRRRDCELDFLRDLEAQPEQRKKDRRVG